MSVARRRGLPAVGAAAAGDGASVEEQLDELKKRFHLLEGDRTAYYETSQWTIKQHTETIAALKQQLRELKEVVAVQAHGRAAGGDRLGSELEKGTQVVQALRKTLDASRHGNHVKEAQLQKLQDALAEVVRQQPSNNAGDPHMKAIRDLENRLDKAMIKFNEAQSIKKTYEQIVKQLKDEKVLYDAQIVSAEQQLKSRQRDFEELMMMSHDARRAKEMAEAELQELAVHVEEGHQQQQKALAERQAFLAAQTKRAKELAEEEQAVDAEDADAKASSSAAQPATVIDEHVEQQQKRIMSYEDAFRKIKEATGVVDVNEVIQKFLSQEDTFKDLLQLQQVAQDRIEMLQEEKKQMKAKMEELKYSGSGGNVGGRRLVDEFEQHLADAQSKAERNRVKYERLNKILINVKAGIEHLSELLEVVKTDEEPIQMSDDTVIDVLVQSDRKLAHVMASVAEQEQARPGLSQKSARSAAAAELPSTNIRIRLPGGDQDQDDDDDGDDAEAAEDDEDDDRDLPLERDEVKRRADATVEKMLKKKKGRKKRE